MNNTEQVALLITAMGGGALLTEIIKRWRPSKDQELGEESKLRLQRIEQEFEERKQRSVIASSERQQIILDHSKLRDELRADIERLRTRVSELEAQQQVYRKQVHEANNQAQIYMIKAAELEIELKRLKDQILDHRERRNEL